jgi:4-hydroxybenzoate polyprenyltransferase
LILFNVFIALFLLLNCINDRLNLFYSISILLFLILLTRYYLLKSSSFRLELFDFSLVLVGLGFLFSAKF